MPREQQDGHVEYKPLMRMDFDKLSRRRQVLELQKLGMAIESGEETVRMHVSYNTRRRSNASPQPTDNVYGRPPLSSAKNRGQDKATVQATQRSPPGRKSLHATPTQGTDTPTGGQGHIGRGDENTEHL